MINGSYKGDELKGSFPQPTLPDVSLDDDDYGLQRKLEAEKRSARGVRRQNTDIVDYDVYNGAGQAYPPVLPYEGNYDDRWVDECSFD